MSRLFILAFLALAGLLTTACKKDAAPADYSAADNATIQKYIADKAIPNAQHLASGLYFVPVVTNPTAAKVTVGQTVSVLYTGTLLDGTVFDASSQNGNLPVTFVVGSGQVIAGFDEGISLMRIGEKATLLIPSGLAYGSAGRSPNIPPNSIVRFDVEVVDYAPIDDALITKYIADNKITNAQKQPSGLYFVPTTTNPSGTPATAGKTASVLYTGMLLNGTVFDASSQHGNTPITFVIGKGQVIPGFDEGISLMHKGEKATLLIPSGLAYGPNGAGTSVPSNTVLRFDVELVDVN
ncbi:FKBP-type peptidyl-prolyl cis-trans isomerase [Hymenobacter baengnokdamensis]|uniref:FKBP-type peptidyl-prolyl cis-trans isomerase n=1 Tax=Hymenobacter baengnokdamensis TaxID=2615203 RepID=UPI00177F8735|nr:FKBP-type peptidyl-prolyl cis-trans isomerase [Hymenobacter baengnokdamensis]